MNKGFKELTDRIEIYKNFIKDGKVKFQEDMYNGFIADTQKLIDLVKSGITPESFNSLRDRDKWDIYKCLMDNNITWLCRSCEEKCEVESPFMGSIHCSECDGELTHRTNGGQSNPFNWTFKI